MKLERNKPWSGSITLPDTEEWNRPMYSFYRDSVGDVIEKHPNLPYRPHLPAYVGVMFAQRYGSVDLDGVTTEDILSWLDDGENEKTALIGWLGKRFDAYFSEITNPND